MCCSYLNITHQKRYNMFFLSLLWPFGAFIISIYRYKYRNFAIASLLLAIMYALCMQVFSNDLFNADITRNLQAVSRSQYLSWTEIFLKKDFFLSFMGKLLCYISDDIRFLGVCFVVINTIIFLRCFYILDQKVDSITYQLKPFSIVLIVLAFCFWDINSLRFKIATTFYIWCVLEYFINRRTLFRYLSILSPFIHFGFFIAVIPFLLYKWLKDKIKLIWVIFFVSFFLATPSVSLYMDQFSREYLSESISESVSIYSSEEGLENMAKFYEKGKQEGNLNRIISRSMVEVRNYTVMACVFALSFWFYRYRRSEVSLNRRLNFLLLFCSFANIASSNSQGQRFYEIVAILAICFFILIKYQMRFNLRSILILKFLIMITFIIVSVNSLLYIYIGREASNLSEIILLGPLFKFFI